MSPEESTILAFSEDTSKKTGKLSVLANDYALDGSKIEIKVVLRSIHSESEDAKIDLNGG